MNRKLEANRKHNSNNQELFLTGVSPSYEPISSVWEGSDGDLLEATNIRDPSDDSERRTAIDPINAASTTEIAWKDLISKTMRLQRSDGPQYTQR